MSLTPNLALDLDQEGLALIKIPLIYQGKHYLLTEASEGATIEYQDEMLRLTKPDMETGKPTSVEGLSKLDALLVSRCLFLKGEGTALVPITSEEILSWSSRAVQRIRDKIREISELKTDEVTIDKQIKALQEQKGKLKKVEGLAKNVQGATVGSSA